MIAGVNRDTFKEFEPKYRLKRSKTKAVPEEAKVQTTSSTNYPKV